MIFITGDTHGTHDFSKLTEFAELNQNLTKSDYMIIVGDFGGVWRVETLEKDLKPYMDLPFTVLFVDGNHENFDMLNKYTVETWNGGKTHRIKSSIIHLMRGQVFEIEGESIFTFGGGISEYNAERIKADIASPNPESVLQESIEVENDLKETLGGYQLTQNIDKKEQPEIQENETLEIEEEEEYRY